MTQNKLFQSFVLFAGLTFLKIKNIIFINSKAKED